MPTASSRPTFMYSVALAIGVVESCVSLRVTAARRYSEVPFSGRPSTPKIPDMITSSVTSCIFGRELE